MITSFESGRSIRFLKAELKLQLGDSFNLHHLLQIPLIAIRISVLVAVVLANARINVAHDNQRYKTWT